MPDKLHELVAGAGIGEKDAGKGRGRGRRAGLLDAAHLHARVARLDDNGDTNGVESLLDAVAYLHR